jgi:hypothetical protein
MADIGSVAVFLFRRIGTIVDGLLCGTASPAVVVSQATLRLELGFDIGVDEHAARYDLDREADDKDNEESKVHVGKDRLAALSEARHWNRARHTSCMLSWWLCLFRLPILLTASV